MTAAGQISDSVDSRKPSYWHGIGRKKLGMWLFIAADSFTFGALVIGDIYLRTSSQSWPTPFLFSHVILVSVLMTLCLLNNSLAMAVAVKESKQKKIDSPRRWLAAAFTAGAGFVILQVAEWLRLIALGLTPSSLPASWINHWPDASPLFGACFFAISGFHLLHVFVGLIYLAALFVSVKNVEAVDVEVTALYWHFVNGVWLFILVFVYFLSVYR